MKKIKAILFDMDGVLIDAKDWHYQALNEALGLFGMAISRYDHLITYNGLPTKKKLQMLTLEKGLPKGLHKFLNELKQQYTLNEIQINCKPLFIHQYLLTKLKAQGFKLAVCSNSIKSSMELMLSKANIIQYFDFLLSNQDVSKSKPDPEIYTKAMNKLKLNPEECLIIEDSPHGLLAAKESGAYVLEVNDINDVNFENINKRILVIEKGNYEKDQQNPQYTHPDCREIQVL
jgi:beta-phosphoglucomutase